jgi:hypothetical protein
MRLWQVTIPDFEICWFGHIGDGNLHLNILKPADLSKDEFFAKCLVVNKYVFETVKNTTVQFLQSWCGHDQSHTLTTRVRRKKLNI